MAMNKSIFILAGLGLALAAILSEPASAQSATTGSAWDKLTPERQQSFIEYIYAHELGDFVSALKLAPEVEATLKQRWLELQRGILAKASAEAAKDETPYLAELKVGTYRILADYLTSDQWAAYAGYLTQLPEREQARAQKSHMEALERSVPGLTEPNRTYVAATYAEVKIRQYHIRRAAWPSVHSQEFLQAAHNDQIDSFGLTLQKLEGHMDQSQLNLVRAFYANWKRTVESHLR